MSCASSGRITKLKQSIFAPFDIYGLRFQKQFNVDVWAFKLSLGVHIFGVFGPLLSKHFIRFSGHTASKQHCK
jgi:hypothetical protein